MEYIFVYSYQPTRGNSDRLDFNRHIREMEPGLTMMEMIHKVEEHLRNKLDWWCDPIVVNVIPNIVPMVKESEE